MTEKAIDVSIVVPAYNAERTLQRCIDSLVAQDFTGRFEVIIVVSADESSDVPAIREHPLVRVISRPVRTPAAVARNLGVEGARGNLYAFTDADVIADREWIARLVAANDGRIVAGSVGNGTPRSAAGTAEYLVAFLDLHPQRPPETAWHGATCNLLIPKEMWTKYGPWVEDMRGGEDTLLTATASRDGNLRFAPEARVTHLNRTRLGEVVRHQYEAGEFTAHLGRRGPYKWRPLVRISVLAPIAAVGRLVSLYARVLAWDPSTAGRALLLLPVIVVTLAGWGSGLLSEGLRLDMGKRERS